MTKKKSRKLVAQKGRRRSNLGALFDELATEYRKSPLDYSRLTELFAEIERAPDDKKEKLKRKDKELAYIIFEMKQAGTVFLNYITACFIGIEDILWEMKGEEGPPPEPGPRPPKPKS